MIPSLRRGHHRHMSLRFNHRKQEPPRLCTLDKLLLDSVGKHQRKQDRGKYFHRIWMDLVGSGCKNFCISHHTSSCCDGQIPVALHRFCLLRRSRKIVQHGRGSGKFCIGPMRESRPCAEACSRGGNLLPLSCATSQPFVQSNFIRLVPNVPIGSNAE